MSIIKPVFLLSDSQLLFWKQNNKLFLNKTVECFNKDKNKENLKAAYVGASNGDDSLYFDIFKSAMKQLDIINCRMIPSKPNSVDINFLNLADLVLLAGGDVIKGWEIFQQNGLNNIVLDKYHKGSVLIGVSAGAVQLGLKAWSGQGNSENLIDTFKVVPYIIDVHDEKNEWKHLFKAAESENEFCNGIGIPSGGGMIFYPDRSVEAIRYSLTEIVYEKVDKIKYSLILPVTNEEDRYQNKNFE